VLVDAGAGEGVCAGGELSGVVLGALLRGAGAGRDAGRGGGAVCRIGSAGAFALTLAGFADCAVSAGAVVPAPAAAATAGTGAAVAGMGGGAAVGAVVEASSGGAARSRFRKNQPPTPAIASRATAIIPCRRFFPASCWERSVACAGFASEWLPIPTLGYDADASANASDVKVPVAPPGCRSDE